MKKILYKIFGTDDLDALLGGLCLTAGIAMWWVFIYALGAN